MTLRLYRLLTNKYTGPFAVDKNKPKGYLKYCKLGKAIIN
jgi:hypothetical protein